MSSVVKTGDEIVVDYAGTLADGNVFDKTEGRTPFRFKVDSDQVIKGMSAGVVGMTLGETKEFTIPAAEAYGKRDDRLVFKVPRDQIPPEAKEGQHLSTTDPQGQQHVILLEKIEEAEATLDGNHPLAGQDLTFKVTVRSIK
jgi:FKBP-type peptidyl-prolyl cis-trans isomerase 2